MTASIPSKKNIHWYSSFRVSSLSPLCIGLWMSCVCQVCYRLFGKLHNTVISDKDTGQQKQFQNWRDKAILPSPNGRLYYIPFKVFKSLYSPYSQIIKLYSQEITECLHSVWSLSLVENKTTYLFFSSGHLTIDLSIHQKAMLQTTCYA